MKSVTLEGDVYDPSGSLSGGSKPNTSGILEKMQALKRLKLEFAQQKQNFEKLSMMLKVCQSLSQKYGKIKGDLEMKEHELELLKKQYSGNPHFQVHYINKVFQF